MRVLLWGLLLAIPLPALADGSVEGVLRVTRGGAPVEARYSLVFVKGYNAPGKADAKLRVLQKNRAFEPPVLALVKGQSVEFTNDEPAGIWHHVFSLSDTQKFDLGRYKSPERRKETFYREGRIDIFCDIHKEMFSTLWVLPNPSFEVLAAVPPSGAPFHLDHVKAGSFTLVAWNRLGTQPIEVPVIVRDGATTKLDVTLELGQRPLDALLTSHPDAHGRAYTDDNRKKETGDW